MYQCRNSYSQQVTKPNAEIQLKADYFLQDLEFPRPIIETGIYLSAAFVRGNTIPLASCDRFTVCSSNLNY